MMYFAPASPAAFVLRKRQALGSPLFTMISGPGARRVTFSLLRRSSLMNKAPDHARKALGKGLSALLSPRLPTPPLPPGLSDAHGAIQEAAPASVQVTAIRPNPL